MNMIIIPIDTSEERCPKCSRVEDIKSVCRHCGYEYEDEETPSLGTVLGVIGIILLIIVGFFFVMIVFTEWAMEDKTLLDAIIDTAKTFWEPFTRLI